MPHPRNRRERFLVGKHKGVKRAKGETAGWTWSAWIGEERKKAQDRWAYLRRNTTKICSCAMCGNPRRSRWGKKKERLTLQERRYEPWSLED